MDDEPARLVPWKLGGGGGLPDATEPLFDFTVQRFNNSEIIWPATTILRYTCSNYDSVQKGINQFCHGNELYIAISLANCFTS